MAFISSAVTGAGLLHTVRDSRLVCANPTSPHRVSYAPLHIEAAKHVQFKAAKKADRLRPRKHRPSDINRAPPTFNPEPLRVEGLPPVLTIVPKDSSESSELSQPSAAVVSPVAIESNEETESPAPIEASPEAESASATKSREDSELSDKAQD